MAIDIGAFFSDISNKTYSNLKLKRIFDSVIYTSLLITFVLVIIIYVNSPRNITNFWLLMKICLYVFLASSAILSIHKSIIRHDYEKNNLEKEQLETFNNRVAHNITYGEEIKKVIPMFDKTEQTSSNENNTTIEDTTVGGMISNLENII